MIDRYFGWLCSKIYNNTGHKQYTKLLLYLFNARFIPIIEFDDNRASDGINLRYEFADEMGYPQPEAAYYLDDRECSILEMMIALAIKCENIMYDGVSDRTYIWFWDMIRNLGLIAMTDEIFSEELVEHIADSFNDRDYDADGTGGLFRVPNFNGDMRVIEIWYQMQAYLQDKS